MARVEKIFEFKVRPKEVFNYLEDMSHIGHHLGAMSAKLHLEILSENATGLGATYHWTGTILGFKVDFVVVTESVKDEEKAYHETRGLNFDLSWSLAEINEQKTRNTMSVACEVGPGPLGVIATFAIHYLFAKRYVNRGLDKVLNQMKNSLEKELVEETDPGDKERK